MRPLGRVALLLALAGPCGAAETYSFDAAQYAKKPYEIGGHVELKGDHFGLRRGTALYALNFAGQPQRDTLDRTTATLKLNGKLRAGDWVLNARTHSEAVRDPLAHTADGRFDELVASWKPREGVTVDIGKAVLKWGKGYAWNPVGFIERAKDPNDPELAREGFTVLSADIVRTFDGPVQTVAFTPLLVPVTAEFNDDFGRTGHLNVAAKLYVLYRDTDLDFYVLGGGSRSRRYGADFSRNLGANLEVHGEWARVDGQDFQTVDAAGVVSRRTEAASSWLLGVRYLTERETTYIVEFYRNGTGVSSADYRDFASFVGRAAEAGPGSALFQRARALGQTFGRQNPQRNYLYVRAAQKEPFDILYFTPAITAMVNLEDRSYSIAPELLYTGRNNLELRARAIWLGGGRGTDFGEKQNDRRIELLARLYF